jgi:hypothetical protein
VLEPGEALDIDGPRALCLGGFEHEATRLLEAALRLSGWRSARERWEQGTDALARLDAAGGDLSGYVRSAWQWLERLLPDEAAMTLATTHPSTRQHLMPGTGWTGFVLNRDTTLAYHRDTSNAPGWTAVLAMRQESRGGWLHLPEWDVWLRMAHGEVAMFPGLTTWHGVSPVDEGLRWSLVTYPKRHVPKRRHQ